MKLEVDRKAFAEALAFAGKVVPTHSSRPILRNVLLTAKDALTISATDMEVSVRIAVEKSEVATPGTAVIQASKLTDIASKLMAERLTLSTNGEALLVKTPRSKFKLLGDKPDEFPAFGDVPEDTIDMGINAFGGALDRVSFCTATERTRYALNGVYYKPENGKAVFVATDGKRLAKAEFAIEEMVVNDGVIIPLKAIAMLRAMLGGEGEEAGFHASESTVYVACGNVEMISRTIEGHFPDYDAVIPKGNDKTLILPVADFKQIIIEGSLLADAESSALRFAFDENGKHVASSRSRDAGSAEVKFDAAWEGGPLELAFNPQYLLDILKAIGEGNVALSLKHESSAALLTFDKAPGCVYVVMPISIN